MENKYRNPQLFILIISITLLIFVMNLLFRQDTIIPVLYAVPVLMTLFYSGKKFTLYISVLVTLLTIATFFVSDFSAVKQINILVSITGIWIAFYFIQHFKNAFQEESKNRERLNALFEYATEGIVITSNKGEIKMVNPIALTQFGYSSEELLNKNIEILIPNRYSERHVKHRETYNSKPVPRPMGKGTKLFARRKDGSEFPVEISLSNFKTEEGSFVIAFIIDVSERSKSEELLQIEKDLAQKYLDIAPVIFLVLDENGNVSLINQNGCLVLGTPEQNIVGKNWFENFVPSESIAESKDIYRKMISGQLSSVGLIENEIITSENKRRLIAWKTSIIRDERGNPVSILSSGEDITEKKEQEKLLATANKELKQYSDEILKLNADLELRVQERTEELAKLIHKLESTNKELASEINERKAAEKQLEKKREELRVALEKEKDLGELKSRFVTMASHEFRTPLSTILSSASLISSYNDESQIEKRKKHIERIKSAVHNLNSILNDFLSLGRLEEGMIKSNPTEFDIRTFATKLIGELGDITKAGQKIIYNHQGGSTAVLLDENLVRNICFNLLSNAIKYSNEGDSIEFDTRISEDRLIIEITDKGIGIPQNEQQHIFQRFFRANNASNIQGTGLGLNIVKKYTELMNGGISFKSEFEKGTTFTVSLPSKIADHISV